MHRVGLEGVRIILSLTGYAVHLYADNSQESFIATFDVSKEHYLYFKRAIENSQGIPYWRLEGVVNGNYLDVEDYRVVGYSRY